MTAPATGADVLRRVADLTGFDAARVDGTGVGTSVAVAGVGGVGVRSLIEACRVVDPALPIGVWRPDAPNRPGVALLVVDPSSSVGDEEIELMSRLRASVGTVAVVCTKIDVFWEWPRILRAHRRLLDPFEQVPVFAVSSAAALAGAADESGVDEVVQWARESLSAPPPVRVERARVAAAQGAVDHLVRRTVDAAGAADEPADSTESLLHRRRTLLATRDRGRTDRLAAVRTGLARTRSRALADAQSSVRALTAEAVQRATDSGGDVEDHARWLRAAADRMAAEVEQRTGERLDEVSSAALIGLDGADGPDDADGRDGAATGQVGDPNAGGPPRGVGATDAEAAGHRHRPLPTGRRGEDALLVLIGASTGLGVGRLAVAPMQSVHTLQWISMPLTLLLGIAVAIWVIRVRRTSVRRGELRAWSADVLADTRARLEQTIGLRVNAAEARLSGRIGRYYERRARQVTAEVADIDDRLRRHRDGTAARADRQRRADLADRASELRTALAERSRELWDRPAPEPRTSSREVTP
ncbi:hypothetical protein GCM10009624_24760 [Gordonia sinesedis]